MAGHFNPHTLQTLEKPTVFNYAHVDMREPRVTFFFGNRRLEGIEGEPVAKALFRAGVRTLSYSVKYKRPRGIHCARGRCVMCHMEIDGVPGVPTCITPLEEGMRIRREDFRPFYAPFLVAAARVLPFPAGFYYRMFTRPALLRNLFLGSLRRMAGVGRLVAGNQNSPNPSPRAGDHPLAHVKDRYDVAVIGAGLSGMSAAVAAAENGADVLLVDEYGQTGGHSLGEHRDGERTAARIRLSSEVEAASSITRVVRTTALGFYPPDTVLLGPLTGIPKRWPMKRVRAGRFIFATGAYDVVPLFDNNDTPGVLGARSMRLLLERDEMRPGQRAVIYGSGQALADAAFLLLQHDIEVAAAVDASGTASASEALPAGVTHIPDARVTKASGQEWLTSVRVKKNAGGVSRAISCDLLCVAFNGQGAYELPYQAGFRFEMSADELGENRVMLPTQRDIEPRAGVTCSVIGDLAGDRDWRTKLTAGTAAGKLAGDTLQTEPKEQ